MVKTEISRKFRLHELIPHLEKAGFAAVEVFTDAQDLFSLLLLRRLERQRISVAGIMP